MADLSPPDAATAAPATPKLRIALIASSRFPIREPFAGGLEAHVWSLTKLLRRRGHTVSLFAAEGSDAELGAEAFAMKRLQLSAQARQDVTFDSGLSMEEHHAYLALMMDLGRGGAASGSFDVIHNHSLHYLPIAMSRLLSIPMISTLHAPPTPWLESAIQIIGRSHVRFVAVSRHTEQAWRPTTGPISVIHNGIDCARWPLGPGGGRPVWTGRIVPEKSPHLAARAAALAGRGLDIAGPIIDRGYFEAELAPLLNDDIRYVGHLTHDELCTIVGRASCVLVTPSWDEPFGLVVAEALASGTPVAGFARGGIPEIVDDSCARLVAPGDVPALAIALLEAELLPRAAARKRAEDFCSAEVMADRYESLFLEAVANPS